MKENCNRFTLFNIRHYANHKKKLKEIHSTKVKGKDAKFTVLSPSVEESLVNMNKYKADLRVFEKKGTTTFFIKQTQQRRTWSRIDITKCYTKELKRFVTESL